MITMVSIQKVLRRIKGVTIAKELKTMLVWGKYFIPVVIIYNMFS